MRTKTGAKVKLLEADPQTTESAPKAPASAPENAPSFVIEADVDGRRVKLTAKDEIVLECGKASITLRRNGKIVVRGTHIETHADGVNRIKGGQVRFN
jgi:hypothetical protein